MPPWATFSPLECSEGGGRATRRTTSRSEPRELAGLEDDVGRGHDVDALQAPQESTLFFHLGLDASSATSFSKRLLSSSACLTAST